jgi:hypothetical protein
MRGPLNVKLFSDVRSLNLQRPSVTNLIIVQKHGCSTKQIFSLFELPPLKHVHPT